MDSLKRLVAMFDIRLLASLIRVFKIINRRVSNAQPLCFTLDGQGNMGSHALVLSAFENLPKQTKFVGVLPNLHLLAKNAEVEAISLERVYPSLSIGHYFQLGRLARLLSGASKVYVIGADNLDGAYSEMLSAVLWGVSIASAQTGIPSKIFGFSWNDSPTPFAVKLAKWAAASGVKMHLRDSLSFNRFQSQINAGVFSADIAFALPDAGASIETAATSTIKIVVCGAPHSGVSQIGAPSDEFVAFLEMLSKKGQVSLVPSVDRPGQSEPEYYSRLEPRIANFRSVSTCKSLFSPMEFQDYIRDATLVITFRMHPAILSIKNHVPVVMFEYQGKMAGLANDVGLESFSLPYGLTLENATSVVLRAIDQAHYNRAVIADRVAAIKKRAFENFD